MIEQLLTGFGMALRVDTFVLMSAGLFGGMLVGALPGFHYFDGNGNSAADFLLPRSYCRHSVFY